MKVLTLTLLTFQALMAQADYQPAPERDTSSIVQILVALVLALAAFKVWKLTEYLWKSPLVNREMVLHEADQKEYLEIRRKLNATVCVAVAIIGGLVVSQYAIDHFSPTASTTIGKIFQDHRAGQSFSCSLNVFVRPHGTASGWDEIFSHLAWWGLGALITVPLFILTLKKFFNWGLNRSKRFFWVRVIVFVLVHIFAFYFVWTSQGATELRHYVTSPLWWSYDYKADMAVRLTGDGNTVISGYPFRSKLNSPVFIERIEGRDYDLADIAQECRYGKSLSYSLAYSSDFTLRSIPAYAKHFVILCLGELVLGVWFYSMLPALMIGVKIYMIFEHHRSSRPQTSYSTGSSSSYDRTYTPSEEEAPERDREEDRGRSDWSTTEAFRSEPYRHDSPPQQDTQGPSARGDWGN